MKVFYCKVDGGNFGDDMNGWFWDELFPEHSSIAPDTTLFGIGSILWRQNFIGHDKILVMGSGSGYGVVPSELPKGAEIGFVRGPRTAELLGLAPEYAITDPAAMVSTFDGFQDFSTSGETVFIPHIGTAKLPLKWTRLAERAGVSYVSPAEDSQEVILKLARAQLVLAESLHGAIIADAFRVPFVPVCISPTFNTHKWQDWAESLEMEIDFQEFLVGMKETRKRVSQIKKALFGHKSLKTEDTSEGEAPKGTRVAAVVSQEEKAKARRWVSRLSPAIEMMLVRDLKRAARLPGFLSTDKMLRTRQTEILNRIDEIRYRLAA